MRSFVTAVVVGLPLLWSADSARADGKTGGAVSAPADWEALTAATNPGYLARFCDSMGIAAPADIGCTVVSWCGDSLTDDEKSAIVEDVRGIVEVLEFRWDYERPLTEDEVFEETILNSGFAIQRHFEKANKELSWWESSYQCRHHVYALISVLSEFGIEATMHCAEDDWDFHAYATVQAPDGKHVYIVDPQNGHYVKAPLSMANAETLSSMIDPGP